MKKIYTFLSLVCISSIAHSQSYSGAGTDELWSNTANWSNSTIVASGAALVIWKNPTNIDVDVEATQKNIANLSARTLDLSLSGVGTHAITIDNGNTNANWAGNTAAFGIKNLTTAATTLKVDCNVTFSNTAAGFTILRNDGHVDNSIEMGANSVLDVVGNGTSGTWSDQNIVTRKFNFNGEIKGTKSFVFSKGDITFGATSNNPNYEGNFNFTAGSTVTVNSENVFIDGTAANRLQANASGTMTLNTANTIVNGADLAVKNTNTFTVNINANQTGLGQLMFVTNGGGTIALYADDAVTEIAFESSKFLDWRSGNVVIYGFKEGVVSFGADATGLDDEILPETDPKTYTQFGKLSNIVAYTGMDDSGSPLELGLDETGKLQLLTTISTTDHSNLEFSMYPNPVRNILTIQSDDELSSVALINLLGQKVYSSSDTTSQIDMFSLETGMYVLQLSGMNGAVSTKKIIKE